MSKWGLFVGGALLAGVAVAGWQAIQPAPVQQGHSMVPPDTSNIAMGDPIEDVRLPQELSADAVLGKRAFDANARLAMVQMRQVKMGSPHLCAQDLRTKSPSDEAFQRAAQSGVRAHHWKLGTCLRCLD